MKRTPAASAPGKLRRSTIAAHAKQLPLRARIAAGAAQALMSAMAALLAYLPTKPLGLREGFWASITAIAVMQAELGATQSSARDQFAGAAVGGLISALVVAMAGERLPSYLAAVVLSMWACWILNMSTAARLAGSTATIIVLVPHTGSAAWMMMSRIAEVGWGIAVAIGVVWIVSFTERRWARR